MKIKLLVVIVLALSSSLFAQQLVEKVPENAALYIGWRGTIDPGPGYKGSHTESIINSGDFVSHWSALYQTFFAQVEKSIPADGIPTLESIKEVLPVIIHHPGALYLSMSAENDYPSVSLMVSAGEESKSLIEKLNQLLAKAPKDSPVHVTEAEGLVTIAIIPPGKSATSEFKSIASNETFKKSASHLQPDSFVHVFINLDTIKDTVKALMAKNKRDEQMLPMFTKILNETGIANLHSVAFTGGFVDKNWQEQLFIDAPAPRVGLLALFEAKPFDADLLKHIPASSTEVGIARFDFMKLLSEIKRITTAVSPEAGDILGKGIGIGTLAIGKNIETDLIEPLGSEWVSYSSVDVGTDPLKQVVLISKLDNGFKAKQGLTALWLFMINTANTFIPPGTFDYKSEKIVDNELTVFSLKLAGFAPSWAASNGYVYAAFDPRTVIAAARYKGTGITENKTMQDMITRLGPKDLISASFYDVPKHLPQAHGAMQHAINEWYKLVPPGIDLPKAESLLPSAEILAQHASPAAIVVWMDDSGIYGKSEFPFPGANIISSASFGKSFSEALKKTIEPMIENVRKMQQNNAAPGQPSGGL